MSTKPIYQAFIVVAPKSESKKANWIAVGAVWPHKNGEGFDLVIPEGLSVSGRIVCMPPKPEVLSYPEGEG